MALNNLYRQLAGDTRTVHFVLCLIALLSVSILAADELKDNSLCRSTGGLQCADFANANCTSQVMTHRPCSGADCTGCTGPGALPEKACFTAEGHQCLITAEGPACGTRTLGNCVSPSQGQCICNFLGTSGLCNKTPDCS